MSKLPSALQALHYLLIRIRHHAAVDTDPAKTARLLDHAEYLIILLMRGKEDEFRRYLVDSIPDFPELEGVLQRYDEALVPA